MGNVGVTVARVAALFGVLGAITLSPAASAQELEPRAYAPLPVATTFYLLGIGKSDGGAVLDPSLDIENVDVDFWFLTAGAGYTFDLLGRQARILAVVPYFQGDIRADVSATPRRLDLTGFADPRIKFTIGLLGLPALTRQEFATRKEEIAVGASITIMPPLGAFDSDQVVNVGYNRWGFKPEIGISQAVGPWTLEASLGAWFFTSHDEYFPGHAHREQDPIAALQGHVGYNFDDGSWIAANAVWFTGGQTSTNGIENPDRQDNKRLGLTYSLPIAEGQSLKFTYSTGTSTRRGADFDTFGVTWLLVRF